MLIVTVFKLFFAKSRSVVLTNGSDVQPSVAVAALISTCAFMCSCWVAWRCLTLCTSWLIQSQELSCTSRQRESKELVAVGTHLFLGS